MPRERLRLAAAIGLQLLILALVPWRQLLASWRGQEVTLATAPFDPIDVLTGAYVRLAYDVERLPPDRSGPEPEQGAIVYLVVERAEPAWRLVRVAEAPPPPAPDHAVLRAEWRYGGPHVLGAGRLYLPAEKAAAAETAMQPLRGGGVVWRGFETPAAPRPPPPLVDLRVDEAGNVHLLRLRIGAQVFSD